MDLTHNPQVLLRAMQAGDQQALAALWREWAPKVQLFARMQLRPCGTEAEALAQEVTADVFHAVWLAPDRFDGRVAFGTWLLTLARNKAIDCLRKRLRRLDKEQAVDEATWDGLEDEGPGPQAQLHAQQQRQAVLACLEKLRNPLQREALMLWALEDMPLQDIAQVQQCPENTVKTRLFHGRKNLRTCLEQQGWHGECE